MHISLLPPPTPAEAAPRQALLEDNLVWLREELEGARPDRVAAVRHEVGVVEQLAGRDSVAVREHLAAANALPRFKEPVEQLIVLIERHRSFKNLPTLLDHSCKTADGPEELARSLILRGWAALVHERDDVKASAALEGALTARSEDPIASFSLEWASRRLGNREAYTRALELRVAAARGAWAGILKLDLAEALAANQEYERAHRLLIEIAAAHPELCFRALELSALVGRRATQPEWILASLQVRTDLILAALDNDLDATAKVPPSARQRSRALHHLLETARLEQSRGRDAAAFAALTRASDLDPDSPIVTHGLLRQAFALEQHTALEQHAPRVMSALPPHEAAALWTQLGQSRLARNEPLCALEALDRALELEPTQAVPRSLAFDLLRGTRNDRGYASALEQLALVLDDPKARQRHWLLAAHVWASAALDNAAAQRALTEAEAAGAAPLTCIRVSRGLAHATGDQAWFARATQASLELEQAADRAGAALQLWRLAVLGSDTGEADKLLGLLEAVPEGRFAARLIRAYVAPDNALGSAEALHALALHEPDAGRRGLLEWSSALRLRRADSELPAIERLRSVHSEQPANLVVAGTLAGLLERTGAPNEVAAVLRASAAARSELAFAASLYVDAGLRSWHAGDAEAALGDFTAAERRSSGSASAFVAWLNRNDDAGKTVSSDDARSRAGAERLMRAVERVAPVPAPGAQQLAELNAVARTAGDDTGDGLLGAARLLLLIYGRASGTRTDPGALERFALLNADCAELADTWRYLDAISQSEVLPKSLEENARRWAMSSKQLAAALEWLGAAQRVGYREREIDAWHWLASLTPDSVAEAARANAALVAHLCQIERAPIVAGDSPEVRLTNMETAIPGCDPRRRIQALDALGELYGAEASTMTSLLRGYNLLALGDAPAAAAAFRQYVDVYPDEPAGWEGLLATARQGDDPALLAEAAAALGNTSLEPTHAARLFEEAADVFSERLHDDTAATIALSRAVELDIRRESSVERLLALLRDAGDAQRLIDLAQRRLEVSENRDERLALEWERARAARQIGDTATCMHALVRVLELEPEHARALALSGELHLTHQRYAEAADVLGRLAMLETAAPSDRLTSGLCAVDLFENQLDDTRRAVDVLSSLHRAGLTTLPVRERLARAAAKSAAWDEAVVVLEQLMFERDTDEHRAEAARLALVIHRDRRQQPHAAGNAATVLLNLIPDDAETLDLALSGGLESGLALKLLGLGRNAIIDRLAQNPLQPDLIARLARIAGQTRDLRLAQVSSGALALFIPAGSARADLALLEQRISLLPQVALATPDLQLLTDPQDDGHLVDLLAQVSPYLNRSLGPTLESFQLGRRERIAPSAGHPSSAEVAAWVLAFGLGEFELYASPMATDRITVIADQPLAIVVGSHAIGPLGPLQRQELVRALYAIRRGAAVLTQLGEVDVAALAAAACALGGATLDAPHSGRRADFARQLERLLPRKARRALPAPALALQARGQSLSAAARAALASMDRAAALAAGDVSVVLSGEPGARTPGSGPSSERARRLLGFVLSPAFESLRDRCGVTVR